MGVYLAALFTFVSVTKVQANMSLDRFDPEDDTAFYWTEAAVHYRYARMVAEGRPIPRHDIMLQYPEGVDTFRALTVVMEYVAGYTYRLLAGLVENVPFHVFLIWLTSFFSSLSLIPAYFLARRLFRSELAGLVASLFYGLSLASARRMIGNYGREDFALPFLFGAVALLAMDLDAKDDVKGRSLTLMQAGGAGLLLSVGLASWHFSRFFFLAVAVALTLAVLLAPRERLGALGRTVGVMMAVVLPAAMLAPVLRAKLFWASPQVALCLAVVAVAALETRRRRPGHQEGRAISFFGWTLSIRRLSRWAIVLAPLLVLSLLFRPEGEGYGHVWALLAAKIRYLGVKPADPAALPYEARVLWVQAFNSPTLLRVLSWFWPHILVCPVAAWQILGAERRERNLPSERRAHHVPLLFVATLTLVFAGLFLLVARLSAVAVFFLSVAAGGCAYGLRPRRSGLAAICLLPVTLLLGYEFLHMGEPTLLVRTLRRIAGPRERFAVYAWQSNRVQVARWIAENTPPDAVIASRFSAAPLVLTYANRAIALQPKFEAAGIRRKVREFNEALYSTEEALAAFCEQYGVTHFLFDFWNALELGPDSPRYVGDALRLSTRTPAYEMQFAPERLKRFRLTYQNFCYRLYKLVEAPADNDLGSFPYQPMFDIRRYGGQTGEEAFFDDTYTEQVMASQEEARSLLKRGRQLFEAGRYPEALGYFDAALARNPSLRRTHSYRGLVLAMMYEQSKNRELLDEALEEVRYEVEIHPDMPLAHYNLGVVLQLAGEHRDALKAWIACRTLDPDFYDIDSRIAWLERFIETGGRASPDHSKP